MRHGPQRGAHLLGLLTRSALSWLLLWSLVFSLLRILTPDPVTVVSGLYTDPATRAQLEGEMGLRVPAAKAYAEALQRVLTFDLGRSFRSRVLVSDVIRGPLVLSLLLSIASSVLAVASGLAVFTGAAGWRGAMPRGISAAAAAASAVPGFLVGLVLTRTPLPSLLGVPAYGVLPGSTASTLLLPTLCNSLPVLAYSALRMLACHEQITSTPWFRNALAFGRSPRAAAIVCGWPFVGAAVADVLVNGTILSLTGAVAVEYVFGLPGLGTAMLDAIQFRDTPVVLGIVGVVGLLTIGLSFLRDAVHVALRIS